MKGESRSLTEGPKERLIERAIEFLTSRGLSDLSLRELAAALGTSHRMLIYHFGSKDALLVEVIRTMERREREALSTLLESGDSVVDVARRFWRRISDPALAPHERLFFEVYSQALQGRPYAVPLLDDIISSWLEPLAATVAAMGVEADVARADTRLGVAVVRGLLLDLLATGDVEGVDAAFERYLNTQVQTVERGPLDRTERGSRDDVATRQ